MTDARPAQAADFPAIRALYAELSWGLEQVSEDSALWDATLAHGAVFVTGPLGAPTAMATLHLLPWLGRRGAPYAFVENVATLPDRRGEGLGSTVMRAALEAAQAAGAYKLCLLTMRDGGARGFYEKLGFSADARWGMALRL